MLLHIFSLFSYKESRRARFYMLLRLYIYSIEFDGEQKYLRNLCGRVNDEETRKGPARMSKRQRK